MFLVWIVFTAAAKVIPVVNTVRIESYKFTARIESEKFIARIESEKLTARIESEKFSARIRLCRFRKVYCQHRIRPIIFADL
jgi:hypothetical protein